MAKTHEAPSAGASAPRAGLARWSNLLAVITVPVFLVAFTVTVAFNSTWVYRLGFSMNDVSITTGISDEDLARVARDVRDYFLNGQEYLDTQVRIGGINRPLLNERELVHMKDVKDLVRRFYVLALLTGAYLAGFAAVGFRPHGRPFRRVLGSVLLTGGVATVGIAIVVGLAFLVAFDQVFTLFHQLSFANDFWQLDPRTNYLTRLFPFPFWSFAATMAAVAVVGEAVGLTALGVWLRRSGTRA